MTEIKTGAIISASVQLTNEADTARKYTIKATASVTAEKKLATMTSGSVKDKTTGEDMATFTRYAENNVGVNFKTSDTEEQVQLLTAVNDFVEAAKTYVEGKNVVFE